MQELNRLETLKLKYAGQRCFIMGNGPSLNQTRLELLKAEFVWGFNKVYLLFPKINWRPQFYVTNDRRLTEHIAQEINLLVPQVPDSLFFFPDFFLSTEILKSFSNVYWYREMTWYQETSSGPALFSLNPPSWVVNTATVTIAGLQLAAYMGFNPIYLVGCDTNYVVPATVQFENNNQTLLTSTADDDPNHFAANYSGRGDKWSAPDVPLMIRQYAAAKKILDECGVKVYNATIGGNLEVFPRVAFASLFD